MKATEKILQAAVMAWVMNRKQHRVVVPNSTLFSWEADLISVTRAGLVHEYEMKCTTADFRRDAGKERKHASLRRDGGHGPSYFWYVTADFAIEPPEHAGWMLVRYDEARGQWVVGIKKDAPRLAGGKLERRQEESIAGLLSWRVMKLYQRFYNEPDLGKRLNHSATYKQMRWELDRARKNNEGKDLRIAQLEQEKRDLLALMAADNARLADTGGYSTGVLKLWDNAGYSTAAEKGKSQQAGQRLWDVVTGMESQA